MTIRDRITAWYWRQVFVAKLKMPRFYKWGVKKSIWRVSDNFWVFAHQSENTTDGTDIHFDGKTSYIDTGWDPSKDINPINK